ncbi:MAG: DUF4434 domain-containing protein [Limnochordaceae bacterium]|nr:DUF4434 domain-containing protein [Limnochordaceae bacterium]
MNTQVEPVVALRRFDRLDRLRTALAGLLLSPALACTPAMGAAPATGTASGTPRPPAKPFATGTFIQDWLSAGWDEATWEKEFAYLKEAGMTYIVIAPTAYTFTTPLPPDSSAPAALATPGASTAPAAPAAQSGSPPTPIIGQTIYPTNLPGFQQKPGYPDLVEKYLHYAAKYGMKVFVGLNFNDDWWKKASRDPGWLLEEMRRGNAVATELYQRYHSRYPNTFYGWYWVWEIDNYNFRFRDWENTLISALNVQLDHLTALDPSLPFLFCPFMNYRLGTAAQYRDFWKRVFANTHLRPGDIFAPQDCVGAGGLTIDNFDTWFAELRKAVDTKPGLLFWSDAETFVQADWSSAPLSRFVRQLREVAPYVDNIISFAYTHYYSPNLVDPGFHRTYVDYVRSGGQLDSEPPSPPTNVRATVLTSSYTPPSVSVEWDAAQDNLGVYSYTVYRDGQPVATTKVARPGHPEDAALLLNYVDTNVHPGHAYRYEVRATDFAGNTSPPSAPIQVEVGQG